MEGEKPEHCRKTLGARTRTNNKLYTHDGGSRNQTAVETQVTLGGSKFSHHYVNAVGFIWSYLFQLAHSLYTQLIPVSEAWVTGSIADSLPQISLGLDFNKSQVLPNVH